MKTFPALFIALALTIGLIGFPAGAQDAPEMLCGLDELSPAIDLFDQFKTTLQTRLDNSDVKGAATMLMRLDAIAETARAACNPLQFEGNTDKVIGPVTITQGFYKIILTGPEGASVETKLIVGDCDFDGFFYIGSDQTMTESILQVDDFCQILILVTNATEGWTLRYEQVA